MRQLHASDPHPDAMLDFRLTKFAAGNGSPILPPQGIFMINAGGQIVLNNPVENAVYNRLDDGFILTVQVTPAAYQTTPATQSQSKTTTQTLTILGAVVGLLYWPTSSGVTTPQMAASNMPVDTALPNVGSRGAVLAMGTVGVNTEPFSPPSPLNSANDHCLRRPGDGK